MSPRRDVLLPRHGLVLCATLVENPINLGALCRTAEAFRLEALVLADGEIAGGWEFRRLAVSTQHWQPLVVCSRAQLSPWLQAQAQAGYEVVGLTLPQAPDLQGAVLPQVRFAEKTVLLLGRELTGIPPALVQRCDRTLSIPQFGQVDSLNVHVAAAIASYEYIRQWGMERPPLK